MNLPTCCTDLEILLTDLLFPEQMTPQGRYFLSVHGLGNLSLAQLQESSLNLGEGRIRISHRCSKLQDDGLCSIYNSRPQICRDFECSTRSDCACKGSGVFNGNGLIHIDTISQ
jgi:Fe-S-cluster containining protein